MCRADVIVALANRSAGATNPAVTPMEDVLGVPTLQGIVLSPSSFHFWVPVYPVESLLLESTIYKPEVTPGLQSWGSSCSGSLSSSLLMIIVTRTRSERKCTNLKRLKCYLQKRNVAESSHFKVGREEGSTGQCISTETRYTFQCVVPSWFKETLDKSLFSAPQEYAVETAKQKALEVARRMHMKHRKTPDIVIGADTIVTLEDVILEKPLDKQDAYNMLSRLSGKEHSVFTGVAIVHCKSEENNQLDTDIIDFYEETKVKFADLSEDLLWEYIDSGEPM
ncbi:hypothetical protein AB205_0081780 [Aquarana catesbeiana]|uniref:Acetylserotonin O-methyltransferase dimerisation domain-containing protein n=1 Tax=Aquarana catesbeiana TaxID=8400 RepID=A0A2G9S2P7_AQUCT|nr:hypothetical protein AB205_0081780 [Aquarana catesbeiana]